ncbi:hypothetical protein FSARC_7658 [Fusarium sarcochroum]|uniref:Xaa-Pro dipeptidyl-peptidase C-terminal domain-containing protein n=1 Tax=Fusarium sarcochroum TaxID=1208366 RepID=A0A8H4TUH9_9HYPO|nr:hypothetical protein FSARC_7658 [Fusarium sarcochroum]
MHDPEFIRNVAIVGASGHVGSFIVKSLLQTGKHAVTAITRINSDSKFPENVQVKKVDYSAPETLVEALKGKDALVITLSSHAYQDAEVVLIKAAGEAGVPWIMPNDWSPDTTNQKLVDDVFVFKSKVTTRNAIAEIGKSSYISLSTGFWYEWSLAIPAAFGIDFRNRKATFYDEGETAISVGRAVAAILSLPTRGGSDALSLSLDELRNKVVYVKSFTLSQKDMLSSAIRVTGTAADDWAIVKESSQERYSSGLSDIKEGKRIGFAKMMYTRVFFPDGCGNFKEKRLLNSSLALPEEDIDEATKRALERLMVTKSDSNLTSASIFYVPSAIRNPHIMAPVERGWITFIVDRLAGWWSGLPGETCSYTVEFLQIPVGSVKLAANLYQPTTSPIHGTILVRTSYGIAPLMALGNARMFASRGYQVLLAACRGTDPSDGQEVVPGVYEAEDGLATVTWMRDQPWYTGSFATFGGSYLGHTQWAILTDPPPDMKAAVISTGPIDFGAFTWGTGAMDAHMLAWADIMTAPKRGITPSLAYIKKLPQTLQPVYDSVPFMDGISKHLQNKTPPWLEELAADDKLTKPLWKKADQSVALKKANIPILQTTGWNDSVLPMVMHQHSVLVRQGAPAFLTIGPWSHLGSQRGPTMVEGFKFIEHHLASRGDDPRTSQCRVFVTGSKEWRDFPSWPPTPRSTRELFLAPNKALSQEEPTEQETSSSFTFDPVNATPHIGMPRPFDGITIASYDDTLLAQRSDVAVFDSMPIESDLVVCGKPQIELYHSSDHPYVDGLVRLSEVDSRGKSTRISDVYKRLDPARGSEPLSLALSDCAHVFRKGTKIRVIVAGGAHPAYVRNLGTGENQAYGSTTRAAVHTIRHSKGSSSKLLLPVTL